MRYEVLQGVWWLMLAGAVSMSGCAHSGCPNEGNSRSFEDICGVKCKQVEPGQPYFDCVTDCLDECVPAE